MFFWFEKNWENRYVKGLFVWFSDIEHISITPVKSWNSLDFHPTEKCRESFSFNLSRNMAALEPYYNLVRELFESSKTCRNQHLFCVRFNIRISRKKNPNNNFWVFFFYTSVLFHFSIFGLKEKTKPMFWIFWFCFETEYDIMSHKQI